VFGLFVVLWAGAPVAYGQAGPDTSGTDAPREPRMTQPAPLDSVRADDVAASDTGDAERAIVSADSLSTLVRDGERLQELFSNVSVRQDTTRLRSNYGRRYLERDEILFTGDVVIYERGDTLRADRVWYNKTTKVGRARSNVRLTDGEVTVRAPRATYYTEEKRSVFPDSVTLVDSNRVLRAQQGTYWSNERRGDFSGAVRLTDPTTYLEADSLTYFRDRERSIATGSVFIRRVDTKDDQTPDTTLAAADTTAITYLFGEWADNQEQSRYSRVERQALLVRVRMDSTGAPDDTLAVRARRLEANRTDTFHRLTAVDSVRIWQADLAAVADSAVYDRVVGSGEPDTTTAPSSFPDSTTNTRADPLARSASRLDSLVARVELAGMGAADTMAVPFSKPRLSERAPDSRPRGTTPDPTSRPDTTSRPVAARTSAPQVPSASDSTAVGDTSGASGQQAQGSSGREGWETPTVQSEDDLPLEETRLFQGPIAWFERSQVWGDSIRVRARNRSLDTVYVRKAAFAAQEDTTVDRIRQLKGKNITAFFRRDSLRQIHARPNGQAIYFSSSEDGTLDGATRASADYVKLYFRGQEVERIKFGAGVQGTAYHKKEYIPDPFRLEGFQWTPERRPTKRRLLRQQRVRERLHLEPLPPPKQQARPIARSAADSAASVGRRRTDAASPGTSQSQTGRAQQRRRRPPRPDSLVRPSDSLRTGPASRAPRDTSESSRSNP